MNPERPPTAHRIARLGAAWIAGVVASMATIVGVESVGRVLYPPPAGLDPSRVADAVAIAAAMPPAAFAVVVLGWVLGAFVGSLLAVRLARCGLAACRRYRRASVGWHSFGAGYLAAPGLVRLGSGAGHRAGRAARRAVGEEVGVALKRTLQSNNTT